MAVHSRKIPIRQLSKVQQKLTLSERFKIRRVEDIVGGNDLIQDIHRHDFFFILALRNGNGSHEIDFTAYKVLDNSIFFLRPGQVHQLELKAGCIGYLVEFNTEFYHPEGKLSNQRLRKAINKNYCAFETIQFNKLQGMLASMFDEYAAKEEGYLDIIKLNLDIFFIEFVRQSANAEGKTTSANSYTQERF